jgi:hypothetical protein
VEIIQKMHGNQNIITPLAIVGFDNKITRHKPNLYSKIVDQLISDNDESSQLNDESSQTPILKIL